MNTLLKNAAAAAAIWLTMTDYKAFKSSVKAIEVRNR